MSAVSYETRGINPDRLDAIRRHAGRTILDVGCGSGAYVLHLSGEYDITGVDHHFYESWRVNPSLFSISDASSLTHDTETVDTVLSFETLDHLADPLSALREYHRVCRKNVIVTVPNCELTPGMEQSRLVYYHWIDRTHIKFYNLDTLAALVEDAGLRVVERRHINRISLLPFLTEALDVSGVLGRVMRQLLARRQRREYRMTCLLVGARR